MIFNREDPSTWPGLRLSLSPMMSDAATIDRPQLSAASPRLTHIAGGNGV